MDPATRKLKHRSDVIDTLASVFAGYSTGTSNAPAKATARPSTGASEEIFLDEPTQSYSLDDQAQAYRVKQHQEEERLRNKAASDAALAESVVRKAAEAGELAARQQAIDRAQLYNDYCEQRDQNARLAALLDDTSRHNEELQEERNALKDERDRLRTGYDKALENLTQSVHALELKNHECSALENDLEDAKSRVESLQIEKDILQRERESLMARSVAAMKANEELTAEKDLVIDNLSAELQRHLASIRGLEAETAQLRSACKAGEEALELHRAHEAALLDEVAALKENIANARREAGERQLLVTQIMHLQLDNARLLSLLRETQEYHDFVEANFPLMEVAVQAYDAAGGGIGHGASSTFARITTPGPTNATHATHATGKEEAGYQHAYSRCAYLGTLPDAATHPEGVATYLGTLPEHAMSNIIVPGVDHTSPSGIPVDAHWNILPEMEASYHQFVQALDAGVAAAASSYSHFLGDTLGMILDNALEQQHWIPADAAALCSRFRFRHLQHVPIEDVRVFLLGLNIIWQKQTDEKIESMRAKCKKKLDEMRRMMKQREPYKDVLQASTINRLHSENTALRQAAGLVAARGGPILASTAITTDGLPLPVAFNRTTSTALHPSNQPPRPVSWDVPFSKGRSKRSTSVASDSAAPSSSRVSPPPLPAFGTQRSLSNMTTRSLSNTSGLAAKDVLATMAQAHQVQDRMQRDANTDRLRPPSETSLYGAATARGAAVPSPAISRSVSAAHTRTLTPSDSGVAAESVGYPKNPFLPPTLSAQLLSVPGSGGKRLDAFESAVLLEQSLAAVKELSETVNQLHTEKSQLEHTIQHSKDSLRSAEAVNQTLRNRHSSALFNGVQAYDHVSTATAPHPATGLVPGAPGGHPYGRSGPFQYGREAAPQLPGTPSARRPGTAYPPPRFGGGVGTSGQYGGYSGPYAPVSNTYQASSTSGAQTAYRLQPFQNPFVPNYMPPRGGQASPHPTQGTRTEAELTQRTRDLLRSQENVPGNGSNAKRRASVANAVKEAVDSAVLAVTNTIRASGRQR